MSARLDVDLQPYIDSDGFESNNLEHNLNFDRGMFLGLGYNFEDSTSPIQRVYIPLKDLNAHLLVTGTTRQGKSRFMAASTKQQIMWRNPGDNVLIYDPKGSEGQEIISWTVESALQAGREEDLRYLSLLFPEQSVKFNSLYRKSIEEISSLCESIIDSETFYKDIAELVIISTLLGLEFLEKWSNYLNPYEVEVLKKMEYAKVATEKNKARNKFLLGDNYKSDYDEIEAILYSMRETIPEKDLKLFDDAVKKAKLRQNWDGNLSSVIPSRTFVTFKDLAPFESIEMLKELLEKVNSAWNEFKHSGIHDEDLEYLGLEALRELKKVTRRDEGFFSKISTTFAVTITKITTGAAGKIFNDCKINPLLDDLTSSKRGVILVIQPFPMKFKSASQSLGRILFSMLNSAAGHIGASGEMLKRRINLNVDEAGSILIPIVKELANKSGGLGFSLYLYTQSRADVLETLDEVGSRILFDNLNTKIAFKGNDNDSMAETAAVFGTKKTGKANMTASDNRDVRQMTAIQDEDLVTADILQRLKPQQFVTIVQNERFIVSCVNQPDPIIKVTMPIMSLETMSDISDDEYEEIKKMLI